MLGGKEMGALPISKQNPQRREEKWMFLAEGERFELSPGKNPANDLAGRPLEPT